MISVLIETRNDEAELARTLASLVSGAVEGVIREVIICDAGSSDQIRRVADQTGCHYLGAGGLAAAIGQSKGDWLLLLEPGARLAGGWIEAVTEHIASGEKAARFTPARNGRASLLHRLFGASRPLAHGLLVSKRQADALVSGASTGPALARRLSRQRIDGEIYAAAL
jgi:glycosyltransferase involved in cell wall biosynthesis